MLRPLGVRLLVLIACPACVTTTHYERTRVGGMERLMVPPSSGKSALLAHIAYEAPILRARLAYRSDCRMGHGRATYTDVIAHNEPHYTAATGALLGGAAVGVGSVALLGVAEGLSDTRDCDDTDSWWCQSPQARTRSISVGGLVVALVGVGSGLYTFVSRPSTTVVGTSRHPTQLAVEPGLVVCGTEPLEGYVISARLGFLRVAEEQTDDQGVAELEIPANIHGKLTIVLENGPPQPTDDGSVSSRLDEFLGHVTVGQPGLPIPDEDAVEDPAAAVPPSPPQANHAPELPE